tara:strand:+ start:3313 stop:3504 length:192 start_codon:yes stop_codon:yes gene_type:complete
MMRTFEEKLEELFRMGQTYMRLTESNEHKEAAEIEDRATQLIQLLDMDYQDLLNYYGMAESDE